MTPADSVKDHAPATADASLHVREYCGEILGYMLSVTQLQCVLIFESCDSFFYPKSLFHTLSNANILRIYFGM